MTTRVTVPLRAGGTVARRRADAAPADPELATVLEGYVEALRSRDVLRLRRTLHPRAKVVYLRGDGRAKQLTPAEWMLQFEVTPVSPAEVLRGARVLGVQRSGDRAVARIERRYRAGLYAEWLWLRRLERGWVVVANVIRWEDAEAA